MYELSPSQFSLAQPLFQSTTYGVLAAATLEGGHPGRVFVDDPSLPTAALVCTRVGYYFLGGSLSAGSSAHGFLHPMVETFTGRLAPEQLQALGDPQILLFYPSREWRDPLFQAFAERSPIDIRKKRMVLHPSVIERGSKAYKCWRDQLPAGFRLVRMDNEFFDLHPELAGEAILFWGSEEAFARKSIGMCLVDDAAGGIVASACSGVFVGGGEVELSISTSPDYRRRGLGLLTAAGFIESCLRRGLKPVWGCFPENQPSVQMARKLGFVDDVDQPICFWEWKE